MTTTGPQIELSGGAVLVVAGLLVAGLVVYRTARAASGLGSTLADAAGKVGEAINPTSPNNLAYKGVNALGSWATDNESWNLGGEVYDLFHPPPGTRDTPLLPVDPYKPPMYDPTPGIY